MRLPSLWLAVAPVPNWYGSAFFRTVRWQLLYHKLETTTTRHLLYFLHPDYRCRLAIFKMTVCSIATSFNNLHSEMTSASAIVRTEKIKITSLIGKTKFPHWYKPGHLSNFIIFNICVALYLNIPIAFTLLFCKGSACYLFL